MFLFDSYFTKSELKVSGLKYHIENILELDNSIIIVNQYYI